MSISFEGKIFPESCLDGMNIDKSLNWNGERFRIRIKNNGIAVEYHGRSKKEEIEKEAERLVKKLVRELAFDQDMPLFFNSFELVMQEQNRTKKIEARDAGKAEEKMSVNEERVTVDAILIRKIPERNIEKPLNTISLNEDEILENAKTQYIKSLSDKLDYESKGAHLYKSFEEIKKVQKENKKLNVSKNRIETIGGVLQKARHIENQKRIPGEFTREDYEKCKKVVKELIESYEDFLKGKDISEHNTIDKSNFF